MISKTGFTPEPGRFLPGHHTRGISPDLGMSGELASGSEISHYNPDFMNRYNKDNNAP